MKKAVPLLVLLLLPTLSFAYGYGNHYAGGMGWFGQTVIHATIHAVVYGIIFKIFHVLGFWPSLLVGGVLLLFMWRLSRR